MVVLNNIFNWIKDFSHWMSGFQVIRETSWALAQVAMTPLTPPSGCESCFCLSEKISELEQRISMLYKIQKVERYFGIIFGPVQATTTRAEELVATAPYPADAATSPAAASTLPTATAPSTASVAAPVTVPKYPWHWLGDKRKASVSSAPITSGTTSSALGWVGDCKKKGRLSFPSFYTTATHDNQLVNRYGILDSHEFPPLAGNPLLVPWEYPRFGLQTVSLHIRRATWIKLQLRLHPDVFLLDWRLSMSRMKDPQPG